MVLWMEEVLQLQLNTRITQGPLLERIVAVAPAPPAINVVGPYDAIHMFVVAAGTPSHTERTESKQEQVEATLMTGGQGGQGAAI